jgi:hypothetical protein
LFGAEHQALIPTGGNIQRVEFTFIGDLIGILHKLVPEPKVDSTATSLSTQSLITTFSYLNDQTPICSEQNITYSEKPRDDPLLVQALI